MELLRNICDPSSLSRPHVTVRYSDELQPPSTDFDRPVKYIDLVDARSFGLDNHISRARFTIYIKAASDELEFLHYKQGYPDSEFHVTAYNGPSRRFAEHLLIILRKFDWKLRVRLPRGTRLEQIPVKSERLKKANIARVFDLSVQHLFKTITSLEMTWPLIRDMADDLRLEITERVCEHLMERADALRYLTTDSNKDAHPENPGGDHDEARPEIYLTPPELARDVMRLALKYRKKGVPIKFGDPAVGTGAFFASLLENVGKESIENAIGIDISKKNLDIARKKWGGKGLELKQADFLHLEDLSPRNLILANPPYLRQQRIDPAYKWKLRERASVKTQMIVSGLSGLYVYFMLLCDAWMESGCVAAWLVPSEFMQTDYGEAVRNYLTERVELLRIHKFDFAPRFEGVHVFPAVVFFRKAIPKKNHAILITIGGSISTPEQRQEVSLEELRTHVKWRIPFTSPDQVTMTDLRIGDLFDIRRGIATGANEFFVVTQEKVKELRLPNKVLKPLLPKAHLIMTDIIESDKNGLPVVSPRLFVIDVDLDEAEISRKYPHLSEYLGSAAKKGVLERTLVKSRRLWYKQEVREPAPFLCTYMGREKAGRTPLRFLWNKSNAIVTNTYLMLYPKSVLREILRNDKKKMQEVFDLLRVSAERTMHEKWRTHARGLHKIEPRELADVRIMAEPKWLSVILGPRLR